MDGGVDYPIYAGAPTVRVLVVKVSEDFGAEAETSEKKRLRRTVGKGGKRRLAERQ